MVSDKANRYDQLTTLLSKLIERMDAGENNVEKESNNISDYF